MKNDRILYDLDELLKKEEDAILGEWVALQMKSGAFRADLMSEADLRRQSSDLIQSFSRAVQEGGAWDIDGPEWEKTRSLLNDISTSRAGQGFSPTETATFVLSLKQPLFGRVQKAFMSAPGAMGEAFWTLSLLIDNLALFTAASFLKTREAIIRRQQDEMLELSTPVVKLWDQILALPLIGTLDSARTQVVMENLLQEIVDTASSVAIIDITGVPTVDTLVAQHLMKTVSAARLMGADCLISGIRPQIAQTMVHLGVSFSDIVTKATLADAIRHAFATIGFRVTGIEKAA